MKKLFFATIAFVFISLFLYFIFSKNPTVKVENSNNLTIDKILDSYKNYKEDELYYISDYKVLVDTSIESELNTKHISIIDKLGSKDDIIIKKKDLLQRMDKNIFELYYYRAEWYSINGSDRCVAILKDKDGYLYTISINNTTYCR